MRFTIRLLNLNLMTPLVFPDVAPDDNGVFADTSIGGTVAVNNAIVTAGVLDDIIDGQGNGTLEAVDLDGQPDQPRNITVTVTDADVSISAGVVTVNGLDNDDNVISETLDLASSLTLVGTKMFKEVTSVDFTGLTGVTAIDDLIDVGYGDVIEFIEITAGLTDPDVSRNLNFTITSATIVGGTITISGTDYRDRNISESFNLADGLTGVGDFIFKTVTSIVFNNIEGCIAADTLKIGYDTRIGFNAGFDLFRESCILSVNFITPKTYTVFTGKSKSGVEVTAPMAGQPMWIIYNPFLNW